MEGFWTSNLFHHQFVLRVQSPIQWPDRESEPGDWKTLRCLLSNNPSTRSSQLIWKARAALLNSSREQQKKANRHQRIGPSLRPGQRVWLSNRNLPLRLTESRKLGPRYIGPFKILKKKTQFLTDCYCPGLWCIHPMFHASNLSSTLTYRMLIEDIKYNLNIYCLLSV